MRNISNKFIILYSQRDHDPFENTAVADTDLRTLPTRLSNDLPAPLVEGKHIHYVDVYSQADMMDSIRLLLNDRKYRNYLEKNIHDYWCSYGTPRASLELMGITK